MAKHRNPLLTRFLSDFTLGFSDGLTVPFALTAGLSSLGRTDTVIYAGLAELCAGSISMGIGGYLAAHDEAPSATQRQATDEEELRGMLHDEDAGGSSDDDGARAGIDEKDRSRDDDEGLVRRHLAPLALPPSTLAHIVSMLDGQHAEGLRRAALRLQSHNRTASPSSPSGDDSDPRAAPWPVACGLSIALGYVVGGVVPLSPYFFAATVGLGLRWSIALCLLALLAFGAGKSWVLGAGEDGAARFRRCLWGGAQMLVLGSLAAGAAVLCVSLAGSGAEEPGG